MDTETILRVFSQIKKPTIINNENTYLKSSGEIFYSIKDQAYIYDISSNTSLYVFPSMNISSPIDFDFIVYFQKQYYEIIKINQNIDKIYEEYLEDPSLWILTYGKIKLPYTIKDEWIYEIAEFSNSLQTKE